MANITRRSPFGDIARYDPFANFDDWFKGFGMRPFSMDMETAPTIKIDLSENDTAYTVRAEIPGVKKEDVKVTVEDGVLTIQGERKQEKEEKGRKYHRIERAYGRFVRSFTLPDTVDEGKVRAEYADGVLKLHLPKSEKAKPKQIDVKIA